MKKNRLYDITVIGGGASGLMAAVTAASLGCTVLILDHNDSAAKKILSTGNGRCNFTNRVQGSSYYRCADPAFVIPALKSFDSQQTIRFFEQKLHILSRERNGYMYPRNNQASTVRNALLKACEDPNITLYTGIRIRSIRKTSRGFQIQSEKGDFQTVCCILAAGGKAFPKSGSDGSGYLYARKLGHHIVTPLPALVPLISDTGWLHQAAGVRAEAEVTLFWNGQRQAGDRGEVQITDYGISGIPVFQISRYASEGLHRGFKVTISVDFVPDMSHRQLRRFLQNGLQDPDHFKLQDLLNGVLNSRLTAAFLAQNKKKQPNPDHLIRQIKDTRLNITGTKTFQQAQVTAGGIDVGEIDADTMESQIVPGLYFAGEIVDVDGICGGYNLQWAWSSGHLAAESAAKAVRRRNSDRSL